ncbi:MAG TPA: VapB-type antitoxin [Thermoprotei archaeon]|nr:VapB-type antitoxin [Thermoprotei archaeon]
MAIISVRVSDEIKKRMDRLKHINWSEVIRRAIIKTLEEEEGRNLARAVLLNEKIRKKAPEGWDSTEIIRYWRQRRYGANSK